MKTTYQKRGYLLEDFRLFHLNDTAGTQVDFHYHEFCKVLMLRSGSGGYTVEGKRYSLQKGDIVLIGSRCVHRPEFPTGVPYERIIIYIDPEFLRSHSTQECDLESVFSGQYGHVLRAEQSSVQRMFALAEELERELAGEDFGRVLVSRGQLLRLLVEVGRMQRQGNSSRGEAIAPNDQRIRQLLEYIDSHLGEELPVDALAERLYLSKYHLMRLFKEETGQSIHGYISHRRLMLARDLIGRGTPVTDACFQVGFRSYSSFFRAYVKLFGTTPTGRMETAAWEESYE